MVLKVLNWFDSFLPFVSLSDILFSGKVRRKTFTLPALVLCLLLLSGLLAQSVDQQTIECGRGYDSAEAGDLFSLPRAISHFLTMANPHSEIHGFTLAL